MAQLPTNGPQLVVLCWRDAFEEAERGGPADELLADAPGMIRWTAGWLVGETAEDYVLASDWDNHRGRPKFQTIHQYPKGMVEKVIHCIAKRGK